MESNKSKTIILFTFVTLAESSTIGVSLVSAGTVGTTVGVTTGATTGATVGATTAGSLGASSSLECKKK